MKRFLLVLAMVLFSFNVSAHPVRTILDSDDQELEITSAGDIYTINNGYRYTPETHKRDFLLNLVQQKLFQLQTILQVE